MQAIETLRYEGKPITVVFDHTPETPATPDEPPSAEEITVERVLFNGVDVYPLMCEHCLAALSEEIAIAVEERRQEAAAERRRAFYHTRYEPEFGEEY